ncbi:prolipoprotein diacylglyceryl transferase family protein [Sphingomonas adhaesiva]|uniref:prolipoprotein diacylglyceryl transferase family protein n=1 Tax=Sphingomonas adhaesiva TaxID=28212 RepID=UPI003FA6C661
MLAMDRGLAVLCIAVFFGLAALAARFRLPRVSAVATSAILVGLVTARIGYVAAHWSSYADAPLSVFALWQGGFSAIRGLAGAAATLAIRLDRTRSLAAGLGALAVSGGLWFALQALIPPVTYGPFPYDLTLTTATGAPLPLARFRAGIRAAATRAKVDCTRLQRDLKLHGADIDALLARTDAIASAIGFSGTPALIVGSQVVAGAVELPALRQLVATARAKPEAR